MVSPTKKTVTPMPLDRNDVVEAAQETNDHPLVRITARVGYVASGVVHLLIAYLAIRVALTPAPSEADQSAAMSTVSGLPGGPALLVVLAVGFVGLALWQFTEAVGGLHARGIDGAGSRAKAVGKAVAYIVLAWVAVSFARGLGQSGSSQSAEFTARVMQWPGGPILVALTGVGIIAIAVYHVVKGVRSTFLDDLVRDPGTVAVVFGRVGYPAKGVALGIVGGLMVLAGMTQHARSSQGLSGALAWLEQQPFGPYLLAAVALGIGAYGVYSFFRAKYAKV